MKVFFVAGIHGVGKTTGCEVVSKELGIPHFSASQIIKNQKSSAVDETSKLVADVDGNQRLLIQGVSRILENGHFLLDGHFTMRRKSDGGIEPIDIQVFRELHIGGIMLYTDDPGEIVKRMYARDDVLHPIELLALHQKAEVAHAEYVAAKLTVPLVMLQAFDTDGMANAVRNWLYE